MRGWLPFVGLIVASVGCGGEPPPGAVVDDVDPNAPTWARDVAPIVERECLGCHVRGGIAPFSLETYEDAAAVAERMAIATAERTMPPWGVDSSGACGTFQDVRQLDDDEIATIGAWVDAGALEGAASGAPLSPPPEPPGIEGGTELAMTDLYVPNEHLTDDYRCFVLDPGLDADRFLAGYEVHPGVPSIVHHVVLFGLAQPEDDATVAALDAADPGPGYTCFGGVGVDAATPLAVWAPGTPATHYPEGTGLRLPAGRKIVLQVHYNLDAGASPDRTSIVLDLRERVVKEAVITGMADLDFVLPPGESAVSTTNEIALTDLTIGVYVHAVYPHMHRLGQTMRLEVDRAGGDGTDCMVDVPRWDFNWQRFYSYDRPLLLGPGDTLRISCTWDTRDRDGVTTFGEGTEDEMCIAALYVTW